MENDKLVRLSDVERWILTESACIDTPADRDAVVERMRYSIPAVDAVEVRHGEWIWDGYVYDTPWQCSECQKLNDIASNYCPYCGARMDGRREEERNAAD